MPHYAARLVCAVLIVATAALGGCAIKYPEKEITALSEVGSGSVLLVGSVEVVPPLRPGEKKLDIPNDLFGMEKMLSNRAMLTIDRSPDTPVNKGVVMINPELGRTFFFAIPKDAPYMVGGYVMVAFDVLEGGVVRDRRIVVPGTLRLDMRPGDQAIYVGTLRLKRDEFNEVTDADLIDNYRRAAAEFKKRFGPEVKLRKAMFRTASR